MLYIANFVMSGLVEKILNQVIKFSNRTGYFYLHALITPDNNSDMKNNISANLRTYMA